MNLIYMYSPHVTSHLPSPKATGSRRLKARSMLPKFSRPATRLLHEPSNVRKGDVLTLVQSRVMFRQFLALSLSAGSGSFPSSVMLMMVGSIDKREKEKYNKSHERVGIMPSENIIF